MLLFLLLLIAAGAVVAVYASQNTATQDVTLLSWHWSAVPDWVPVVLTAVVIGGLFLLYMIYSGVVHGVRVGSMRRRVSTREAAINDMREDHTRLREENARLRSELRGMNRGIAATADDRRAAVSADGDRVPVRDETKEPVGIAPASSAEVDRSRTAEPFRPRATFGERVRAFFTGREPAGS
jgi:uncharacterized integral membrane protein